MLASLAAAIFACHHAPERREAATSGVAGRAHIASPRPVNGYTDPREQTPGPGDLDYAWINNRLTRGDINSLDGLLIAIKENYKTRNSLTGFSADLGEYIIQYHSRSQNAKDITPELPRIILPLNRARTLLAYNGKGESLEVLQFNNDASTFESHLITFFPSTGRHSIKDDPDTCKSCHGASLRPNWESYFLWPGSVGAVDDALEPAELPIMANVEALKKTMPRYAILGALQEGSPYNEEHKIRPGISAVDEPFVYPGRVNLNLTAAINVLNGKRLAAEVKRSATLAPFRYAIFAAAVCVRGSRSIASGADDILTFLPDPLPLASLLESYRRETYELIRGNRDERAAIIRAQIPHAAESSRMEQAFDTATEQWADLAAREAAMQQEIASDPEPWGMALEDRKRAQESIALQSREILGALTTEEPEMSTALRFIVEAIAGGSTNRWSTAFIGQDGVTHLARKDPLTFSDGGNFSSSPAFLMGLLVDPALTSDNNELLRQALDVMDDFEDFDTPAPEVLCDDLRSKSKSVLAGDPAWAARLGTIIHAAQAAEPK